MKAYGQIVSIVLLAIIAFSCGSPSPSSNKTDETTTDINKTSEEYKIDFEQDLSRMSLSELRILKAKILAGKGHCFMEADLRGYFTANYPTYDSIMYARWENSDSIPEIKLTEAEMSLTRKIEAREAILKANNFVVTNGRKLANIDNVINLFQFNNISPEFLKLLRENNFAIVPQDKIQLFHVYEENDYHQVPNFVTTDLYLQLYHMYFSYILRELEEKHFIASLKDLSEGMYNAARKVNLTATTEQEKNLANYTATFYAIPYYLLTGTKKEIPTEYKTMFEQEINNINLEKDNTSDLLEYTNAYFPYSLCKARGHYTRNDSLRKYFKAMTWLQKASFCLTTPTHLQRSIFMAHLLATSSHNSKSLTSLYNAIYEPTVFLIGEPDNLSINDIVAYLRNNNINDLKVATGQPLQKQVNNHLQSLKTNRNKIKPKIELTCPDKINFMPQRYLFDNEIIQELVDIKQDAQRAFPRGLDVFAALGNKTAEAILLNDLKEGDNWGKYSDELTKLKSKFKNVPNSDNSVYNKWMHSLVAMQQPDPLYPAFMQTDMWAKKNLNSSLASWAELKHDALLYAEQPDAAECGGAAPPDPITVGYVEPNVNFWNSMIELISLSDSVLKRNGLYTDDIKSKSVQLKETAEFLLSASKKELQGKALSEAEYKAIEVIGASTEYLSLSLVSSDKSPQEWSNITGPDKSVAVVADVYTRNVSGCSKNGILHEAVGNVNDIYVVVEIEGYLYITKGATFSYYEFVQPLGTRLTDEEWQKMLERKKNLPTIPKWMEDLILPLQKQPIENEKILYSSGC